MELRHLRYFVAVAEELNFTRAAERLGISQPPLSLQIRQFEKELGSQLFRRRTRDVQLTDTGTLMLEEARQILRQVETARTGVRRRARGETGRIILGSAGATYFHPVVAAIVRRYNTKYPKVIIDTEASNTPLLAARLRIGKIDIAFVRPPVTDGKDLTIHPLIDEDSMIALPTGHRLSDAASLPLGALAKETFVLYPRANNPGNYDAVIAACRHAGFSPILGQEAPQVISVLPMVAAGLGVSIVPQSISRMLIPGVTCLPIKGLTPRAEIALAYRRFDRSPAIQNLVAVAKDVMREHSVGDAGGATATGQGVAQQPIAQVFPVMSKKKSKRRVCASQDR